ncbi:MAG TPA: hypothetical protein PK006_08485 [Saprospiraceae bacterium]|nr:hypothetical protein [Saprospiraceae bacterium]
MNAKALRNENSLDLLVLLDQAKGTMKTIDQKLENFKLKSIYNHTFCGGSLAAIEYANAGPLKGLLSTIKIGTSLMKQL